MEHPNPVMTGPYGDQTSGQVGQVVAARDTTAGTSGVFAAQCEATEEASAQATVMLEQILASLRDSIRKNSLEIRKLDEEYASKRFRTSV